MINRKTVAMIVAFVMILTMFPVFAFASEFTDIPNDWSKAALQNAVNNGLLNGNAGKLMPKENLTRAEMAAVLNRAFGTIEKAEITDYKDVRENAWYYEDMAKAVQMKTFVGNGGKLNPSREITREEAFVVLARAFKLSGADESVLNQFLDKDLLSSWGKEAVAALVSSGYVSGSNGILNPKKNMTRAEFAQVMDHLLKNYINKEGTYTKDLNGNVIINVPNVILKDMTITGDLVIGDGVGNGEVTLDGVEITRRAIVRGGGVNSIKIIGTSKVNKIIIVRVDGQTRVCAEEGTQIGEVVVDGNDDVTIGGDVGTANVIAPKKTRSHRHHSNLKNQEAPTGIEGVSTTPSANNDGKITGVTNVMEYKLLEEGTTWTPVTGTEITELTAGIYKVRYAAKKGFHAGESVNVMVATNEIHFTFYRTTRKIAGYHQTGGEDVVIPATISGAAVTNIGHRAFKNCKKLQSVTIGNNVTYIGDRAFLNCSELNCVTIWDRVERIDSFAFEGCIGLTKFIVDEKNNSYSSVGNVLFNKDKTILLICSCAKKGEYIIPESVQSIGEYAFYDNSGLTSVTIPDSVEGIGKGVFRGCTGIESVIMGKKVRNIGDEVFLGCKKLTSVIIPNSVENIGIGAFACSGLTSVRIPDRVESIGNIAFIACRELKSVTIPNSVETIGSGAFACCKALKRVTIGNNVKSIGDGAFENKVGTNRFRNIYEKEGAGTYICSGGDWNKSE